MKAPRKNKLAAATAAAKAAETTVATATAVEPVVTATIAPARNTRRQYLGG